MQVTLTLSPNEYRVHQKAADDERIDHLVLKSATIQDGILMNLENSNHAMFVKDLYYKNELVARLENQRDQFILYRVAPSIGKPPLHQEKIITVVCVAIDFYRAPVEFI